jgi:hypothetical protein
MVEIVKEMRQCESKYCLRKATEMYKNNENEQKFDKTLFINDISIEKLNMFV